MTDILGLDFGSSYVSIVKKGEGLILKEANLVSVKRTQNGYVAEEVGNMAKNMMGKTDDNTVIFSPVGSGEIVSFSHAQYVLQSFIKKLNIKNGLFNKFSIILAVSSGLSDEAKQQYIDLATSVGAKNVILVPKIMCSALGENINVSANNAHLVVDIGGGTVDCAVINLNSIICGSTLSIGSRSLDSSIIEFIKQKYGVLIGPKVAQTLKEEIGSLYPNDTAEMNVNCVTLDTKTPSIVSVSAKDIFDATYMFLDEIARIIETTIATLSPEISSDVVRNGIVVCGGYSKMVGLEKYLRQKLNLNVLISDESNNSAVNGLVKLVNRQDLLDKILENL